MPLEKVLERLEGVKRNGGGFVARCPHHDDRHASLSISEGRDGRALLNCFSGCEFEEIVAALGLEPRDLFDRAEPTGGGGASTPPNHRATVQPLLRAARSSSTRGRSSFRSSSFAGSG